MDETKPPRWIARLVTWFAAAAVVVGAPAVLVGGWPASVRAEPVPVRAEPALDRAEPALDRATAAEPVQAVLASTTLATVATAATAPAMPAAGDLAVWHAMTTLGTPYRYGGSNPGGFDCSGLVMWAWRQAGVSLPRTASEQRRAAMPIGRADLRPGDLVFYYGTGHVGIFIGGDRVVHSPRSGKSVEVVPVDRGGMTASSYGRVK